MIKNKTVGNVMIYTGMAFLQKAVSFLMLPLYTAVLSPKEFGIVNQVTAIGSIYVLFLTFALDEAAARLYFKYRTNPVIQKRVLGSITFFSLFISIIGGVILLLFSKFFYVSFISDLPASFIFLSIIIVATSPVYSIYQKVLRIQEKAKLYAIIMFVYSIIQILLTVLFIIWFRWGSFGFLLSMGVTSALMFIYCISVIMQNITFSLDPKIIKDAVKYSAPIVPHTLSSWGLSSFTIVVMGKILDSAAVGIYNAINFLSLIINVISKSFIDAYQPWVYKKLEEGEKGKIDMIKAAKFISVAFVFFGFILSILSKEIIEIVINKQYHSGIKIAPIVVYSSVLLFMGSLFAFVLYFYKNTTKYIAFSTIAGAITNIALSLLLIPKYGILGGSVALAIANIVISIIKQIYASKAMNLNALLFDVYILATINLFVSLYLLQNNYSIFIRLLVLIAEFLIISIIYKNLIKYSLNKLDIHLPSYNRYFQES